MKPLIKYSVVISSVLLIAMYVNSSRGCWYYPGEEEYRVFLFNPDVSGVKGMEKMYFTTALLNESYLDSSGHNGDADRNLSEWFLYCREKATLGAIDTVLNYTSPEVFFGFLKSEDKYKDLLIKNSFMNYLRKPENKEALMYLLYAKKYEHLNFSQDPWEEYSWSWVKDDNAMYQLKLEGAHLFRQTVDTFLRDRYAFQLVRASRYVGLYEEAIQWYDSVFERSTGKTVVKYWALSHKASCTHFRGDPAYADYLFSQVFELSDEKSERAAQGFAGKDLEKTLAYCKNNRERANVHIIRELRNPGRALKGIKEIFATDPASGKLEVLMGREISKLEDWLLTSKYTEFGPASYSYSQENKQSDLAYLKELRSFVAKAAFSKKTGNPSFWLLTLSHLYFLENDFAKGKETLALASLAKGKTERIEMQIRYSNALLTVYDSQTMTDSLESELYKDLQYLETHKKHMKNFDRHYSNLLLAVQHHYKSQSEIWKAGLLQSRVKSEIRYHPNRWCYSHYFNFLDAFASEADMDTIIALLNKKKKTPFEKYLVATVDEDKYRLMDLQGTKYLRKNRLRKALSIYRRIPDAFWNSDQYAYKYYLDANPFYVDVRRAEQHMPGYADTVRYNKRQFVEKLLEYLTKAEAYPGKKDQYYYLAANAYYNMSYYGNSWMMHKYWWSIGDMDSHEEDNRLDMGYDNQAYFGCERARRFYMKAYHASQDKKLKALCLAMAGRCAYNMGSFRAIFIKHKERQLSSGKNYYYSLLEKKYPEYYKKLILECAPSEEFLPVRLNKII